MISVDADRRPQWGYCLLSCAALLAAGLAVGWPALDGGYLGADDEYLIRDHALVNHPSLGHALKLFQITHRDLYQPIPLLTFQIEFALHGGDVGIMHLTNLFIHILNGMLVWGLFYRLVGGRFVPLVVGLLFVVHPLTVECFAWLNGRMIMLSTTFSLAALIMFDYWSQERSQRIASPRGPKSTIAPHVRSVALIGAILLLAALAMMSKVRVGLPFLVLLLPLWRKHRPDVAWWAVWAGIAVVTIVFTVINVDITRESRMFEGAERQLAGPNLARVALALGWYFTHYLWPVGLAPYYAPPHLVSWLDNGVLLAGAMISLVGTLAAISCRRSRVGILGVAWFLVMVAATLPVIPARNLLVADRYVYLSNIGLHWIVATLLLFAFNKLTVGGARRAWQFAAGLAVVGLLATCTVKSRQVTDYYETNDARIARAIEISPDHPTLRTAWGWYHLQRGDFAEAVELARQELALFPDDDVAFYRAMNLRAMARYYLNGDTTGAEADLQAAIARDPAFAKSYYRLGLIYFEQGRLDQATQQLEVAVEKAPLFNPALKLLGRIYRQAGQLDRARRVYQQAADSSRGYDVKAVEALAELDIEEGRIEQAVQRYRELLSWHEAGLPARMNLALALRHLNRPAEAWEQYGTLLAGHPGDRRVLAGAADLLRSIGARERARDLWAEALQMEPHAADLLGWFALHQWYIADLAGAEQSARAALWADTNQAMARLTRVLLAIAQGRPEEVAARCQALIEPQILRNSPIFTYAYEALEFYSLRDEDSPWPYYVTAVLLLSQGQAELADTVRRREFDKRCSDRQWRMRLQELCTQQRTPQSNNEQP